MNLSPIRLSLIALALCLSFMAVAPTANAATATGTQTFPVRANGVDVGTFTFRAICTTPTKGLRVRCAVVGSTKLNSYPAGNQQYPRMSAKVSGKTPQSMSQGTVRDEAAPARYGYAFRAIFNPINIPASRVVKVVVMVKTHNTQAQHTGATSRTITLRLPA